MINDESVEVAAKAYYERGGLVWDSLSSPTRTGGLEDMRAALEAAAPHIHRTAWNEGFTAARAMQEFRDAL